MLPAIDRRSGRSRYTSATRSSSSTATRFSPASTETSSSRFAFGSGARFGGVRRRVCDDDRVLRSDDAFFRSTAGAGAATVAVAVALADLVALFFRLRPPRVPRRRFFGSVVLLGCPSAAAGAGASTVSGSTSGRSGARVSGAWSSDFLRRKNDRGKRCLL